MKFAVLLSLCGSLAMAQEVRQVLKSDGESAPVRKRLPDGRYLVPGGSRIPLTVLNSVSSKNSQPGDQIYLQTLVPIAIENKIVIPAGSYVTGTITDSKRPGKVKGRGEIGMRFELVVRQRRKQYACTPGAGSPGVPGSPDCTRGSKPLFGSPRLTYGSSGKSRSHAP